MSMYDGEACVGGRYMMDSCVCVCVCVCVFVFVCVGDRLATMYAYTHSGGRRLVLAAPELAPHVQVYMSHIHTCQ